MEGQSKGSRGLGAYCKGGQGPPRAVGPSKKKKKKSKHTFHVQNPLFLNRVASEKMWRNVVQSGRPQMTIWRMRIACRIRKSTNTHSEYVTLTTFLLQHGCQNAPQCYDIHARPVLLII